MSSKTNEDDVKHDPHPKKRTKTNIGKHWSNILQNTQKTPKIPQNAPKMSKTNVKNVKKLRKIVQIWTNVNVNIYVNVNIWTNINVIDAT